MTPTEGRVDVGSAEIAYRADGPADAPALAFVNSLGTNLRMWDAQADALAGRFRVVRHDARGHGASDVSREPVTIARLANDLIALLDHLGIGRADVCGLSLGGMTAMWAAAHRPERIARLVLANTGARIGTRETWDARIAAAGAGGMAAVSQASLGRFLGAPFRAAHPDVARRVIDMIEATPPEGYVAACAALRDADLTSALAAIRAPSLVIAGERDESTPPALAEALHAAIAGSELVVIRGAAHLSNVEHAVEFTAAVRHFLLGDVDDA